jgi:hypothetical protein
MTQARKSRWNKDTEKELENRDIMFHYYVELMNTEYIVK